MAVIVKNPDILGGTPVFRGTRVPIQALFDYLEGGDTLEDFLEGFPTVSREAAVAALEEAPLKKPKNCSSHAPKCASSLMKAWISDFATLSLDTTASVSQRDSSEKYQKSSRLFPWFVPLVPPWFLGSGRVYIQVGI